MQLGPISSLAVRQIVHAVAIYYWELQFIHFTFTESWDGIDFIVCFRPTWLAILKCQRIWIWICPKFQYINICMQNSEFWFMYLSDRAIGECDEIGAVGRTE